MPTTSPAPRRVSSPLHPVAHAAAMVSAAVRFLRGAGQPALVGYAAALERRLTATVADTTVEALDRRAIQAHGLALAHAEMAEWMDGTGDVTRPGAMNLAERIYRIGVESGVDAVMAETLTAEFERQANPLIVAELAPPEPGDGSTPPRDHHTYTGDESTDTGLRRVDVPTES